MKKYYVTYNRIGTVKVRFFNDEESAKDFVNDCFEDEVLNDGVEEIEYNEDNCDEIDGYIDNNFDPNYDFVF